MMTRARSISLPTPTIKNLGSRALIQGAKSGMSVVRTATSTVGEKAVDIAGKEMKETGKIAKKRAAVTVKVAKGTAEKTVEIAEKAMEKVAPKLEKQKRPKSKKVSIASQGVRVPRQGNIVQFSKTDDAKIFEKKLEELAINENRPTVLDLSEVDHGLLSSELGCDFFQVNLENLKSKVIT